MRRQIAVFFLGCVAAMGVVGAYLADPKILMVQTVPATAAMVAWWLHARGSTATANG